MASSSAIIEKNKQNTSSVWIVLLEYQYEGQTPSYLALNNEAVTWNSKTWQPAIFNFSNIKETKNAEIPSVSLNFYDLTRELIDLVEENNGATGATITRRVVNSDNLAETEPEAEDVFQVTNITISENYLVNIKLGSENLSDSRCPKNRYLKNNCRFIFKRASLSFTSGGTTEITANQYLLGDTSGHKAKVNKIKLTEGSWAGGDAVGALQIATISGGFQASETVSLYSDEAYTTLVQADVLTVLSPSSGNCGYTGTETSCNRSYARCIELNNSTRFGGFIGVGLTGFLK